MKRVFLCAALLLAGCVGMDFGDDAGERKPRPSSQLTADQRWHLKQAAKSGDHELITTVARMAWDDPHRTAALADYAAELSPDSSEQIQAAIAASRGR